MPEELSAHPRTTLKGDRPDGCQSNSTPKHDADFLLVDGQTGTERENKRFTSTNLILLNNESSPPQPETNYKFNYAWKPQQREQLCLVRWVAWNHLLKKHEFVFSEELQLRVIKKLGDLLPAVKSFRSNDFDHLSDNPSGSTYRIPKKVDYPETLISVDLKTLSSRDLWKLYTEDKYQSISMQYLIMEAEDVVLKQIAKLTLPMIHSLICHHFGNYCLQKIIARDKGFRKETERYCLDHLRNLVYNEYSSRTMQTLAETSDSFRKAFLNFAAGDTKGISKRISYVFLVTSAVNCAKSEEELTPLLADFVKNRDRWLGKKYMKRVIVSLIQKSSNKTLHNIWDLFNLDSTIPDHFNDRYRVYIVVAFIKREFQPTIAALKESLSGDLGSVIQTSYFKLFCDIIFRNKITFITSIIFASLISSQLYASGMWRSKGLTCKFIYLLCLTASPAQFNKLIPLLKELDFL